MFIKWIAVKKMFNSVNAAYKTTQQIGY